MLDRSMGPLRDVTVVFVLGIAVRGIVGLRRKFKLDTINLVSKYAPVLECPSIRVAAINCLREVFFARIFVNFIISRPSAVACGLNGEEICLWIFGNYPCAFIALLDLFATDRFAKVVRSLYC
jgi:hypothetical protein